MGKKESSIVLAGGQRVPLERQRKLIGLNYPSFHQKWTIFDPKTGDPAMIFDSHNPEQVKQIALFTTFLIQSAQYYHNTPGKKPEKFEVEYPKEELKLVRTYSPSDEHIFIQIHST